MMDNCQGYISRYYEVLKDNMIIPIILCGEVMNIFARNNLKKEKYHRQDFIIVLLTYC